MEKIIIFGAGAAGKNFILNQSEYQIVAVADNDEKKHGTFLEDIEVINPNEIPNFEYDKIMITSMYFNPIKKQLTEEIGVQIQRVNAANKNLLKENMYPFEDEKTIDFANQTLLKLVDILNKNNIPYFIDFGTLLGIVRDQELIRWDDDIDLTCYLNDCERILEALSEFVETYSDDATVWKYRIIKDLKGGKSSIVLDFEDYKKNILSFSLDIWLLSFINGKAVQTMNKCDEQHFLVSETIKYKNHLLTVPNQYKKYLEHTYGEWQVPQKDTTFADYPFAFED